MAYIPETTATDWTTSSDGIYLSVFDETGQAFDGLYAQLHPKNGDVFPCVVSFDGVSCPAELTFIDNLDATVFGCGNNYLINPSAEDTKQPFFFLIYSNTAGVVTTKSGDTHTFAIYATDAEDTPATSEQYKTGLFEMCRRLLRVNKEEYRTAYYDMVYKVLSHPGVEVSDVGYQRVRAATEKFVNRVSDSGDIFSNNVVSMLEELYPELIVPAFAEIGIVTSYEEVAGVYGVFTFTYPDGKSEVYRFNGFNVDYAGNDVVESSATPAGLTVRVHSTLAYARQVIPYWDYQPDKNTIPLNELAGNRASFVPNWGAGGLYWQYDAELKELEFTGEGDLRMPPSMFIGAYDSLGLGGVQTVIYGAGVRSLPTGAFDWTSGSILVFLHSATDTVTLNGMLTDEDSTVRLTIYCDNEHIRAGTVASGATVNWHPLSEWGG